MDPSKKRPYEGSNEFYNKKAAVQSDSGPVARPLSKKEGEVLFKILCPSTAVGSIIGKGGSVLNQLKETTGCKIRVSQANEFYPGTPDRVIGIWGMTTETVSNAIPEIISRILESLEKKAQTDGIPPSGHTGHGSRDSYEIRVLIPTTASGSIIGRGGSVIKDIGEKSNCHLNLERDQGPGGSDVLGTKERMLTIKGGAIPNVCSAIKAAFEQIQTDPSNSTYVNQRTSYDLPPQSGYAPPPVGYSSQSPVYGNVSGPHAGSGGGGGGGGSSYASGSYGAVNHATPSYGNPSPGYGMYPPSLGPPYGAGGYGGYTAPPHARSPVQQQLSVPPPSAGTLPSGCTAPIFTTDGSKIILQMGIPDELLGSIIGKAGSVIKEISSTSGAFCQVTQKGDFLPGTNLRSLKITGSQQEVQMALNSILSRLHSNSKPY